MLIGWVGEWLSEWLSEWVSDWVSDWVSGWVTEWVTEWVGETWLVDIFSTYSRDWLIFAAPSLSSRPTGARILLNLTRSRCKPPWTTWSRTTAFLLRHGTEIMVMQLQTRACDFSYQLWHFFRIWLTVRRQILVKKAETKMIVCMNVYIYSLWEISLYS